MPRPASGRGLADERTQLAAELTLLPDDAAAAAERFASALAAWGQYLYPQVRAVHDGFIDELQPHHDAYVRVEQRLGALDSGAVDDRESQRAALDAERIGALRVITPLRERAGAARRCAEAVDRVGSGYFGDDSRQGFANAHELNRFVTAIRRAVTHHGD